MDPIRDSTSLPASAAVAAVRAWLEAIAREHTLTASWRVADGDATGRVGGFDVRARVEVIARPVAGAGCIVSVTSALPLPKTIEGTVRAHLKGSLGTALRRAELVAKRGAP